MEKYIFKNAQLFFENESNACIIINGRISVN